MATLKNLTINDTGFLKLPSGTTAQRPASPNTGMMRFNTDLGTSEIYDGSLWIDPSTGYPVGGTIVTSDLQLHYDFGDRASYYSTRDIVFDVSVNGNHGKMLNGVSWNSANSGSGVFDGVNDYITVPKFTNKPTTQISCEAWIRPTKPSVGTGTIRGGAISSTNTMYLGIIDSIDGGNTFAMHWANQTSVNRLSNWNSNIPNNSWSHLMGTYNGSTTRAYLNSVEIYSEGQTGTIPDATYVVGTYGPTLTDVTHNFHGNIAIARIYNRGLSGAEVAQNFNAQRSRFRV